MQSQESVHLNVVIQLSKGRKYVTMEILMKQMVALMSVKYTAKKLVQIVVHMDALNAIQLGGKFRELIVCVILAMRLAWKANAQ